MLGVSWHGRARVQNAAAWKLMWPIAALTWPLQVICAQDLSPRAYVITPTHSNAIILAITPGLSANRTLLSWLAKLIVFSLWASEHVTRTSNPESRNFWNSAATISLAPDCT